MFDLVLFLPLLGFLVLLFLPETISRKAALAISLVIFVLSLGLIGTVTAAPGQYSFVSNASWIDYPPIHYHVGLDGLSLWLVILTTLLTPIAVLVSWKAVRPRPRRTVPKSPCRPTRLWPWNRGRVTLSMVPVSGS